MIEWGKMPISLKRWAFGGIFIKKGVVPEFKKVKCVTHKAHYGGLIYSSTLKFWAKNEAESVILMI